MKRPMFFHRKEEDEIALVAHDNMKGAFLEWAEFDEGSLSGHELLHHGRYQGALLEELGLDVHSSRAAPFAATSR